MSLRPTIKALALFMVLASVEAGCAATSDATGDEFSLAAASVPSTALLGWGAIEDRVRRGVCHGVRCFRFGDSEREDVEACSMERAWRAFATIEEPVRNPETWGKKIAERVSLDTLRRHKRDRICDALRIDEDQIDTAALEACRPTPFENTAEAERHALLHARIAQWPEPERTLAQLLLDGRADSITAAAWLYREEEEARSGESSMYPQRARILLEARRGELEDLV